MHPIPNAALDDRLAFVGNTGSGKTYAAGTAVERLMNEDARVVIPDPLGVWYGLALDGNGKVPSAFRKRGKLVIFGGPRGDLALTEHSGALIGETVAGMAESCILDLSELKTGAAERRFMLAFLSALYKHKTKEPLHVIFDEADMWAPQRILDREGEAMKLLGMMETICRRGRVSGFIPWLISQRPAVISKNVLSQIDGMIAFKLTSVQDRDALGDWVEGQADKAQWKAMWANMATLQRGKGVVWLPGRAILKTVQFPEKHTFDSSRAPKRGERIKTAKPLKPLNLDKLKVRLATVEAESKANDPRALRSQMADKNKEIATLRQELTYKSSAKAAPDKGSIAAAEKRGYTRGEAETAPIWFRRGVEAGMDGIKGYVKDFNLVAFVMKELKTWKHIGAIPKAPPPAAITPPFRTMTATRQPLQITPASGDRIERPLQLIVNAIRWWNVMGIAEPSQPQVAFVAGYSHKSGTWSTYLSRLRSLGLIEARGLLALTSEGAAAAHEPSEQPTAERLRLTVLGKLDGPLARILAPIIEAHPDGLSQEVAGERAGYSPSSGTWSTYLSRLRSLDLIEGRGELKAQEWLFPLDKAA